MARPTVTEAAVKRARELAAQCETDRPVVTVSWEPPAHDNRRGSRGATIWTYTQGRWNVYVGDLHLAEGSTLETKKMHGLEFFFALPDDAPSLDKITIDYAEGDFVVDVRAI